MTVDVYQKFWKNRAKRKLAGKNIGNLEDNATLYNLKIKHEKFIVDKYLSLVEVKNNIADIGAGEGYWTKHLAQYAQTVVAVDFCQEMLDIAAENLSEVIDKVELVRCPAEEFTSDTTFNMVFISGLFIYLDEKKASQLISNIAGFTENGSYLLLRDGTGVKGRYEIKNQYSKALNDHYSALYRTREAYIGLLGRAGFDLVLDEDMFYEGHELNKFEETRLRIYLFKRR